MSGDDEVVGKERSQHYEEHVQLVGMRLKIGRLEAELSQGDVERKTGIDKSTISRIEHGYQKEMSAGNFFALCEALELDPITTWYGPSKRKGASEPPPASTTRRSSKPPQGGQKV